MKKVLKFVVIIGLFIGGVLLYAKYVGTMGIIAKEYTLYNENLPLSFDGLKIVHFSDVHYNRAITKKKIMDIVNEINLINPDIVVFTGDLVDKDMNLNKSDYEFLTESLSNMQAKYGKYAVLGNHDYLVKDEVLKIFNDSEFEYLENAYEIITSSGGDEILVSGIGNATYNLDDVDKTFDEVKDAGYKLVLMHEPDVSDDIINSYDVDLILGGHSHNGQIRLPLIGALYTPEGAKKYYDEYYRVNGIDIFVSSGIGVSNIDMRLFNKPSIHFYRINKRWIKIVNYELII